MSKTAIISPELTPPVGPFSQAIEVGGFLYTSLVRKKQLVVSGLNRNQNVKGNS